MASKKQKEHTIRVDPAHKGAVASIISKHLTDFLGKRVTVPDVLDQMLMIELGMESGDKVLQYHVRDLIVTHMTERP
jgi:hypothetical protein